MVHRALPLDSPEATMVHVWQGCGSPLHGPRLMAPACFQGAAGLAQPGFRPACSQGAEAGLPHRGRKPGFLTGGGSRASALLAHKGVHVWQGGGSRASSRLSAASAHASLSPSRTRTRALSRACPPRPSVAPRRRGNLGPPPRRRPPPRRDERRLGVGVLEMRNSRRHANGGRRELGELEGIYGARLGAATAAMAGSGGGETARGFGCGRR